MKVNKRTIISESKYFLIGIGLRNLQDQDHFNYTLISFFQLAEITDLAYVDTGDMALDADTYGKALDALTTDTCTP